MRDRLKDIYRKVFVKGQEAIADEQATERFEDEQALNQRMLKAATDTIDLADKLATDGNPHKQRLAALIQRRVIGAIEDQDAERQRAEEAREPIEASPFADSSNSSERSLPGSPPVASLPSPEPPPKRGPGRPRKERPPKQSNG